MKREERDPRDKSRGEGREREREREGKWARDKTKGVGPHWAHQLRPKANMTKIQKTKKNQLK